MLISLHFLCRLRGTIAHITDAPSYRTFFACRRLLIGLTLDACRDIGGPIDDRQTTLTEIHDVIPADGAVIHDDVPRPESNGVPLVEIKNLLLNRSLILKLTHLLHLESLFALITSSSRLGCL